MNPTPTLPHIDWDPLFVQDNSTKKFFDSYKWLMLQYDNKCMRLEEYEKRPNANKKYIMQEKAFLISLAKHLENVEPSVRGEYSFVHNTHFWAKREFGWQKFLFSIIELHGIDLNYFLGYTNYTRIGTISFVKYLCRLAKLTNSIRIPDAFRKNGNFPKSEFNLYVKG